ncbi:MAG: hypothetical protein HOP09_17380 [Hyphomicrobium sp.]|nr:hypothetical protein [Hyphomicrobium sp.]
MQRTRRLPGRWEARIAAAGWLVAVSGLAAMGLGACASSNGADTASLLPPPSAQQSPPANVQPGDAANVAPAVLSADEQALECKQLTGRMQIRILEIRDYNERNRTTIASRALQSGVGAVFGGSKSGLDPSGRYAQDRAMLDAYNKQLGVKGCKTYDLEAELKPQDFRVTPEAKIKPASGKAP